MKKKCPNCDLVNFPTARGCARCGAALMRIDYEIAEKPPSSRIIRRVVICLIVCVIAVAGFYVSLVFSAKGLSYEERKSVHAAIDILENTGFTEEAFLLRRVAVFRSNDNWLNASVAKENAFAATNFPFAIVTIYPDFFSYPADDVERAAILLHEARHLKGEDEFEAYEYVWKNRKKLGWTSGSYGNSVVWAEIRKQTRDRVPNLFVCTVNIYADCTE
jgi:hypothetical protein